MRTTILTLSAILAALGYLAWYAGLAPPTDWFAPSLIHRLAFAGLGALLVAPWIATLMALLGKSTLEEPFFRRLRLARRILAAAGALPFLIHSMLSDVLTEPLGHQIAFRMAVAGLVLFAGGASLYFLDLVYVLRRLSSGVAPAGIKPGAKVEGKTRLVEDSARP